MTIIRTIPMWLAILAVTFNGFSRSGFILCIGGEGYLAVEKACDESPTAIACCSIEHEDATLTDDDHCGDCSDLLLRSHPPITQKSVMTELTAPNSYSLPFMADMARPVWGTSTVILHKHDPLPPAGHHLRTVVLRL